MTSFGINATAMNVLTWEDNDAILGMTFKLGRFFLAIAYFLTYFIYLSKVNGYDFSG